MKSSFFKNENFISPRIEKPAEFEVRGFDTGTKDTPRFKETKEPQETIQEAPPPTQEDAPADAQEPEIKPEPITAAPEQQQTKVPRMLRNLKSDLDGSKWGCSQTHGLQLRVKRTELEEEFQDSWPVDIMRTSGEH